ncbi:MAG TPA: hypothetical protein VGL20_11755 [Candidatus Dormibacteraeota bacterium]
MPRARRDLPLSVRLAAGAVLAQAAAGIAGTGLAILLSLAIGWRLRAPLLLVAGSILVCTSLLAGFAGLLAASLGLRRALPWARPVALAAQALGALAGAAALARGVAVGACPLLLGAAVIAALSTPAARTALCPPRHRAPLPHPRPAPRPAGRRAAAPLPAAAAEPHRPEWWELAGFGLPRPEPRT